MRLRNFHFYAIESVCCFLDCFISDSYAHLGKGGHIRYVCAVVYFERIKNVHVINRGYLANIRFVRAMVVNSDPFGHGDDRSLNRFRY